MKLVCQNPCQLFNARYMIFGPAWWAQPAQCAEALQPSRKHVLLAQGCRCDSGVVPLAQGIGLQPGQFYTAGRAGAPSDALHDIPRAWA